MRLVLAVFLVVFAQKFAQAEPNAIVKVVELNLSHTASHVALELNGSACNMKGLSFKYMGDEPMQTWQKLRVGKIYQSDSCNNQKVWGTMLGGKYEVTNTNSSKPSGPVSGASLKMTAPPATAAKAATAIAAAPVKAAAVSKSIPPAPVATPKAAAPPATPSAQVPAAPKTEAAYVEPDFVSDPTPVKHDDIQLGMESQINVQDAESFVYTGGGKGEISVNKIVAGRFVVRGVRPGPVYPIKFYNAKSELLAQEQFTVVASEELPLWVKIRNLWLNAATGAGIYSEQPVTVDDEEVLASARKELAANGKVQAYCSPQVKAMLVQMQDHPFSNIMTDPSLELCRPILFRATKTVLVKKWETARIALVGTAAVVVSGLLFGTLYFYKAYRKLRPNVRYKKSTDRQTADPQPGHTAVLKQWTAPDRRTSGPIYKI